MKLIPLSKKGSKNKGKYFAKVDDEDYNYLNQWNWSYERGYASRPVKAGEPYLSKNVKMHRVLFFVKANGSLIDHKDTDGLNNQKNNLRIGSFADNARNTSSRKNSTSKYLGVSLYKTKNRLGTEYTYWKSSLRTRNGDQYARCFKSEKEAAIHYDIQAKKYFGEFANLNFK